MASLYTNENIPANLVHALRERGHDVLTSFEAGNANRGVPDTEVLDFARESGRLLITHNRRDFRKLHNAGNHHAGMVLCTTKLDAEALAERIHDQIADASVAGQLIEVFKGH